MANDPANGPLALSGIGAGLPQEAEYDAVYAAVTATERGRWFLAEFAKHNRYADTGSLVAALARIEAALGGRSSSGEATATSDLAAAAEKIQDIAFALRERGADPALCDALEAAVRDVCAISDNGADGPHRAPRAETANADEAVPAGEKPFAAIDRSADRPPENSSAPDFEFELQDREKFAAAAAALAASLSALGEPPVDEPPLSASAERQISTVVIAPHDDADIAAPASPPEPMASNPRWYIEPPDFVFHSARSATSATVASSDEARGPHALLPGAQLLPNPEEDPAELFEPSAKMAVAFASAAGPVATAEPAPPATAAGIPPLRRSAASPVRAVAWPVPIDPLAALHALTEDELLALFG